jgi:hypothetical protein
MASLAQSLANQANAAYSTGPQTAGGKARSSVNARTHGLTGRTLIVRDDEREAFDETVSGLHADLLPDGTLENQLFDQIVQASWNLRRMSRAEADLIDADLPEDPALVESNAKRLQLFDLYRSRAERSLYRAIEELRRLQAERAFRLAQMDEQSIKDAELSVLPGMIQVRRAIALEDGRETRALSREILTELASLPPMPRGS